MNNDDGGVAVAANPNQGLTMIRPFWHSIPPVRDHLTVVQVTEDYRSTSHVRCFLTRLANLKEDVTAAMNIEHD